MTPVARVTFALLVIASFAAFFVIQRIKRTPPVVVGVKLAPRAFSPVSAAPRRRRARLVFRMKRADDVTVTVIDRDSDPVRILAEELRLPAGRRFRAAWDGRDDDGRRAEDGFYRVRVGLRRQGRTTPLPGFWRLDTRRPRPRIDRVAGRPVGTVRAPLILTAGRPRPVRVGWGRVNGRPARLLVERTDRSSPRLVAARRFRPGRGVVTWDGRVDGAPAPPGVYRLRVRSSDAAGNVGLSPARARGIGVTVRGVAVQPPGPPVAAGRRTRLLVDARNRPWRWELRRAGRRRVLARGAGEGIALRLRAPRRPGLHVLTVRAGGFAARSPLVVAGGPRRARLVVLPTLTWQASLPVDSDGDGIPETLNATGRAPLARPRTTLPPGWAGVESVLARLDRGPQGGRYAVTSDLALAAGRGPSLAGHRGVALAGRAAWTPPALGARLRGWVARGGSLALWDTRTLRRSVRLRSGVLVDPGPLRRRDVLGTRLGPLVPGPADLVVFRDGLGLFATGDGQYDDVGAYEPVEAPAAPELRALAGPDPDTPAISAQPLGRGLVLRVGVAGWPARIARDPDAAALTDQAWTLLSR